MKKRLLFITLCLGLVLPVPLLAQAPRDARLAITVADPSGAVIPNATVTIVDSGDPSKAFKPAATTDKGVALFEGLTPGRYTVRAEFAGRPARSKTCACGRATTSTS